MTKPPRTSRLVLCSAVAAGVVVGVCTPAAAASGGRSGSAGGGDPYFPRQGNGGYDVASYQLHLHYDPATHRLRAQEVLTATATQNLSRFDLDLRPNLRVSSVAVDGADAASQQPKSEVQELVVTPASTLANGNRFTVALSYAGRVKPVIDPDGSLDGFIPTDDGAFVANEPQGAPSWFAVNDSPTDKATYDVSTTVPGGLSVIGNGRFVSKIDGDGVSTWRWRMEQPISSYLVTATIGRFDVSFHTTPSGLPYVIALDPREAAASTPVVKKLPAIIRFFESKYGPYPFGSAGAIVDHAPKVGYALETATRPVFDRAPGELTFAHELAHQWFGDDVTVARWQSIWLNEGFAQFSDWLWGEHQGGTTAAERLKQVLAEPVNSGVWNPPPGNPGSGRQIFAASVYVRGAAALEALREKLGDPLFFRILRGWAQTNSYSNATVPQFVAFASAVANQDLSGFFQKWLFEKGKPFRTAAATWAPAAAFVRR